MVKNRIVYIIAVIALALFYIYCDSYTPLIILLAAVILPTVSVILTAFSVRKLSVKTVPVLVSVLQGEDITFEIIVENSSRLPVSGINLKLEYIDVSDSAHIKAKMRTAAAAGERKSIFISAISPHCAIVECIIKKARCCDAFGIVSFKIKNVENNAQVVVMPKLIKSGLNISASTVDVTESDNYSDTQKGDDCSQVFEVRDYVPGDDIRRVHWGLSSKQDKLIVKEYSRPVADKCVVLLETGLNVGAVDAFKERLDLVLSVFMTFSNKVLDSGQGMSVGWYSSRHSGIFFFDVKSYDEIYAVVKELLTESFSDKKSISLINYEDYSLTANNAEIYYIYDSDCCDSEILNENGEKYFFIDVGQVNSFAEKK